MKLVDFEQDYNILDLASELVRLDKVRTARLQEVVTDKLELIKAKRDCEDARAQLLIDGKVAGTNETQRKASMQMLEIEDRRLGHAVNRVEDATREEMLSEVEYRVACHHYDTVKTLIRLATALAGGDSNG